MRIAQKKYATCSVGVRDEGYSLIEDVSWV